MESETVPELIPNTAYHGTSEILGINCKVCYYHEVNPLFYEGFKQCLKIYNEYESFGDDKFRVNKANQYKNEIEKQTTYDGDNVEFCLELELQEDSLRLIKENRVQNKVVILVTSTYDCFD